jgi:putative hemolysin
MSLLLIAVALLVNALLVASRTAVFSASRTRIDELAATGDKQARAVSALQAQRDLLLGSVHAATVLLAALGASMAGFDAAEPLYHRLEVSASPLLRAAAPQVAVIGAAVAFSGLWLIFAELVPRSLGVRHATFLALLAARPLQSFVRVVKVPMSFARSASRLALRAVGHRGEDRPVPRTLDDLREMVREAEQHGLVHGDLVSGVMEFQDREVREIMTPRTRISALPVQADLQEALRRIGESGHSRFPVYDGNLDNVVGVVYARDVYEAARRGGRVELPRLLLEAMVVPWNKKVMPLLGEMRKARCHLALVVDEHGSMLGLVTLEDLIEVIVGEIHDERDMTGPAVQELGSGVVEVEGSASVKDLNADHGLDLPESDSYVTMAGLVLERLGAIPRGGESVEVPGARLVVASMEGHRIARVRVERVET